MEYHLNIHFIHNFASFLAENMPQAHSAYEMVHGIRLVATHDESSMEVSRPFKQTIRWLPTVSIVFPSLCYQFSILISILKLGIISTNI